MKHKRPAVFLDRDGTILRERGYLSDPQRLRFYPSALRGMRLLNKAGFPLVIVTNQSGVARGYFNLATLSAVHREFTRLLKKNGIRLSGIYFCPHSPEGGCSCRKPRPGMAQRAARELNLDLKRSFVVGDQTRDMQLASKVKAAGVLVMTGAGSSVWKKAQPWTRKRTRDVLTAARWILREAR